MTNSAATRSKTKVAAIYQENVDLTLSQSSGQTNHLTVSVAFPPKSTNNVTLVTPDIQNTSTVDGDVSVSESFKSIDIDDIGSNPDMNASGSTTPPTGSTSTNDTSVNFSTSGTGNDAGKKDASMDGANSDNFSFFAHSKSIVQLKTEINDLLVIISSNTGDTSGIHPGDLLSGGALNVAKADLAQKRRSLEQMKTSSGTGRIGDNSGNIGTQGAVDKILGSHVIGGKDTVDVLAKKVLLNNTRNNAVQSITASNVNNLLTSVWKYSQHEKRLPSIATHADHGLDKNFSL